MTLGVGIVGAGLMGAAIACVAAAAGHPVAIVDVNQARLDALPDRLRQSLRLQRLLRRRDDMPELDELMELVTTSTSLDAIAPTDLVVESVTESLAVKTAVHRALDAACHPRTVIASNTSAIPIARLARDARHPERLIGLHFMNPVEAGRAVEVVRGPRTSPATVEAALGFLRSLGREAIVVGDGPGFVVNRLLMGLVNEAGRIVGEGVASPADVDRALTACLGHQTGPFQTASLIGEGNVVDTLRVLHELTGDDRYVPSAELVRRAGTGR